MESGDAEAIIHNNEQSITQIHVSFFFSLKCARKSECPSRKCGRATASSATTTLRKTIVEIILWPSITRKRSLLSQPLLEIEQNKSINIIRTETKRTLKQGVS